MPSPLRDFAVNEKSVPCSVPSSSEAMPCIRLFGATDEVCEREWGLSSFPWFRGDTRPARVSNCDGRGLRLQPVTVRCWEGDGVGGGPPV
eukprot:3793528-Pleurochrysis_carterae.AAC.1